MSAFIVEDETINNIVSHFRHRTLEDQYYYPRRILSNLGYDLGTAEGREKLARDMFALNVEAVNQRYGEGEAEKFRPLNFQYQHIALPISNIQAIKTLSCWHYQCCEGDIPETSALYKAMQEVKAAMAMEIVQHSPEWEAAKWG